MKVSVIIPSLNSPILDRVLARLHEQTARDRIHEILVVGRDEQALIEPRRHPLARLIDTGRPVNAACARNIGIRAAAGEVLAFLDSDCLPSTSWMSTHVQCQTQGHQVVGGGVAPVGSNYWSLSYNLTLFHEFLTTTAPGRRDYLPTLNLSVHRNVIAAVGCLSEDLIRGQDIEWTARMRKAGIELHFDPAAAVEHRHDRTTPGRVWLDCARSGHFMRRVRLQHPELFSQGFLIRNRFMLLLLAPLIAVGVTARIVIRHARLFRRNWRTVPAILFTKIAWCWGAFVSEAPAASVRAAPR